MGNEFVVINWYQFPGWNIYVNAFRFNHYQFRHEYTNLLVLINTGVNLDYPFHK